MKRALFVLLLVLVLLPSTALAGEEVLPPHLYFGWMDCQNTSAFVTNAPTGLNTTDLVAIFYDYPATYGGRNYKTDFLYWTGNRWYYQPYEFPYWSEVAIFHANLHITDNTGPVNVSLVHGIANTRTSGWSSTNTPVTVPQSLWCNKVFIPMLYGYPRYPW